MREPRWRGFPRREERPRCRRLRPRTVWAKPRLTGAALEIDHLEFDFRVVEYAQSQFGGIFHVPRFADVAIEIRIAIVAEMRAGALEQGHRVLGLALLLNDVDQRVIHRHGVRAEHDLLGVETELRVLAEG